MYKLRYWTLCWRGLNVTKTLQITGSLNIGGLENMAANIVRYQNTKYQHDFLIYEPTIKGYEEEMKALGCKIIQIEPPSKSILKYIVSLYHLLKQNHYEIVHIHTFTSSGFIAPIAKLAGVKKIVVHSHTAGFDKEQTFFRKIYNELMKKFINYFSDVRIAVGQKAGEALFNDHFEVIKNGIDVEKFQFNKHERQKIRNEYQIAESDLVIGHVGRIATEKNQLFLIDIFNELLAIQPHAKLMLLGHGDNYLTEVKNKISKLDLDQNVFLLGSVSNPAQYYHAFDVVCFPSLYEGVPLSLIEAQVNGLPIIGSDQIDKQTKLTDNMHFLSLDEPVKQWATEILKVKRKDFNLDNAKQYHIRNIIKEIEFLYDSKD